MDTVRYFPPRLPLLRWLADVGGDLPPAVQVRLGNMLFGSGTILVLGSAISIAATLIAYGRSGNLAFVVIGAIDSLMLPVRIIAWRQQRRPTDLAFATGMLWAMLIATAVFLVVASGDLPMSLLAMAWAFASISGIIGRNFLAPRYTLAQVIIILFGISCSIATADYNINIFTLIFGALFVFVSHRIVDRLRQMTIQVVKFGLESRTQSFIDPLTGLLNRRALEVKFKEMTSLSTMDIGLLYLDLDGFKQINDRLGHDAGDKLLTEVASRLSALIDPGGMACRLGGDEFLVLVPKIEPQDLCALGARVIDSLTEPYQIEETICARVGASVGAVVGNSGASDLVRLVTLADSALYAAKAAGKGRCILNAAGLKKAAEPVRR